MKPQPAFIECPFCGKETVKILRIPFVKQVTTSHCRAGGRNTKIQKSGDEILSGCSACGKSKKEVEEALSGQEKKISDEEKIKRLKAMGLPISIESRVD